MANVRINQVDSSLTVAEVDSLLTPEVLDALVVALKQRMYEEQRAQQQDRQERQLSEGAS